MSNSAPESGRDPRPDPPRMPANPPRIGAAEGSPTPANEPLSSPSVQLAGRDDAVAVPLDNYGEFIGRLKSAAAKLTPRRDALSAALDAAGLLLDQNNAGVEFWGQRRTRVRQLLNLQAAKQQARTYRSLSELHEVALKMEQMFTNRAQRLQQVCSGIRARRDHINAALVELDKSTVKLASSRRIAQERENLSKIAADLSVSADNLSFGVPDPGLRDSLREAREAIILAEALLEVKGN
ncbi:hypothetical protein [Pseudarthrobacter sulfonivorans]|uniref:hypothetical protein n=1 Tax=Pseudarthrobacter sulfonivorans TaxID=121292 RepID=UPI000A4783DB|nr:hypothetical protein [Pseudarthrobacter sulfonivorans]